MFNTQHQVPALGSVPGVPNVRRVSGEEFNYLVAVDREQERRASNAQNFAYQQVQQRDLRRMVRRMVWLYS
jgi:ribosomal protein S7